MPCIVDAIATKADISQINFFNVLSILNSSWIRKRPIAIPLTNLLSSIIIMPTASTKRTEIPGGLGEGGGTAPEAADDSQRSGISESSFHSHPGTIMADDNGNGGNGLSNNNNDNNVAEISPPTPHKEHFAADKYSPTTNIMMPDPNSTSQQGQEGPQEQVNVNLIISQGGEGGGGNSSDNIQAPGSDNQPSDLKEAAAAAGADDEAPSTSSNAAAAPQGSTVTAQEASISTTTHTYLGDKQSFLYSLYDILSHSNSSSSNGTLPNTLCTYNHDNDAPEEYHHSSSRDPTIISGKTPSGIQFDDIITWLPHGKGFIITNKPKFEKEILPTFLPNTKYASFTRRLKRWKFVR